LKDILPWREAGLFGEGSSEAGVGDPELTGNLLHIERFGMMFSKVSFRTEGHPRVGILIS
jgi:hypothetical protein